MFPCQWAIILTLVPIFAFAAENHTVTFYNSTAVVFAGTWSNLTESVNCAVTYTPYSRWDWNGSSATVDFTGVAVYLNGACRQLDGLYDITLDGSTSSFQLPPGTTDLQCLTLFSRTGLTNTNHTITFTNTGHRSPGGIYDGIYLTTLVYTTDDAQTTSSSVFPTSSLGQAPSSQTPPATSSQSSSKKKLSTGAIIGIVIAILAVLGLVVGGVCIRRKRSKADGTIVNVPASQFPHILSDISGHKHLPQTGPEVIDNMFPQHGSMNMSETFPPVAPHGNLNPPFLRPALLAPTMPDQSPPHMLYTTSAAINDPSPSLPAASASLSSTPSTIPAGSHHLTPLQGSPSPYQTQHTIASHIAQSAPSGAPLLETDIERIANRVAQIVLTQSQPQPQPEAPPGYKA